MADKSIVQTIKDAEIDARSLSEFVSEGATFEVARRLAPTIHTLDYYLWQLDNHENKLQQGVDEFNVAKDIAQDVMDSAVSDAQAELLGIRQSANNTEAYVEQTIRDAIDTTVITDSPVSDALVSVDSSVSQRTVNKGVESITDLSTISNPKSGLRIYVKSYHAGLNKGGGYFTYNSSRSAENNGGSVINGWVRDNTNGLSILDFGAKGDGVTDDTQAIVKAIQSGVVSVPDGDYIATEASIDRGRLFGAGYVNGIRVGFNLGQSVSLEDFKSINGNDATQALKTAIAVCQIDGALSGTAIYIPPKRYIIKETINLTKAVTIFGYQSGTLMDIGKAPALIFQNCSGFDFKDARGYFEFRDFRMEGNRTGVVNVGDNTFGNFGMRFSYGSAGKFENMVITGFDVGRVTHSQPTDNYTGAYRYFNYIKFLRNTYNSIQKDYTTDDHFFQCEFKHSAGSTTAGYVLIQTESGNTYQSANFIDCTFEAIGTAIGNDYSKYGVQVRGRAIVRVIGGYQELCPKFVDIGASYTSSSYIHIGSTGKIHAGGGLIDIKGAFARAVTIELPPVSDSDFWQYSGVEYRGFELGDGILGHGFGVTDDGVVAMLNTSKFTKLRELSIDALPIGTKELTLMVEVEYKAPVNKTVSAVHVGVSEGTFSDPKHYDDTDGWRRKVYTNSVPLKKTDGNATDFLHPRIILGDAVVGGVEVGELFYIRSVRYTLLSN